MALDSKLFTKVLTTADSPFILTAGDGLELSSIKVNTGGSGTVLGTKKVGNYDSDPVPVSEGDIVNLSTDKGIKEVTITITAGTISIMGT